MDRCSFTLVLTFLVILLFTHPGGRCVSAATFTFVNRCGYTVWPGILAGSGSPRLETTGFELPAETSRAIAAPTGWSGRFWGRTGCTFPGSCLTADCGSGTEECNGAGASPPATLAEFTLGSGGGRDFYDVSLVDGYNVQMLIEGAGGAGTCAATGCAADINERCPAELRAGSGGACMSACGAFGSAEYCCSGAYGSPATCRPSVYSEMFKAACPRSYSYAYDDASSTFTCIGADYTITFCPSSTSSQKRDTTTTPTAPGTSQGSVPGSGMGYPGMGDGSQPGFTNPGSNSGFTNPGSESGFANSGSVPGFSNSGSGSGFSYSGSGYIPGTETKGTIMPDGSWLAGLAMGSSPMTRTPSVQNTSILTASVFLMLLIFSLRKL